MMNKNQIAEMTPRILDWLKNKSTYGLEITEALLRDCLWCLTHLEQVYNAEKRPSFDEMEKLALITCVKKVAEDTVAGFESANQPLIARITKDSADILCNKIEKL